MNNLSTEAINAMEEMISYLKVNNIHYYKFNDYLLHFTINKPNEETFIGLFEIDDRKDPSGLYIVFQFGNVYGNKETYESLYKSIVNELRKDNHLYPTVSKFMLY